MVSYNNSKLQEGSQSSMKMIRTGALLESLVNLNLIRKIFLNKKEQINLLPKPYLGYAQPAAQDEVSHPWVPHISLTKKKKRWKRKRNYVQYTERNNLSDWILKSVLSGRYWKPTSLVQGNIRHSKCGLGIPSWCVAHPSCSPALVYTMMEVSIVSVDSVIVISV